MEAGFFALLAAAVVLGVTYGVPRMRNIWPPSERDPSVDTGRIRKTPGATTSTVQIAPLFGSDSLLNAYKALRERPHLRKIQAIWSADYQIRVEDYFTEESTWHRQNPHVKVERLLNTAYINEETLNLLKALGTEHDNLDLYICEEGNFEVYLCEYEEPGSAAHHAGILVINDPTDRKPEFGVLFDAEKMPNVEMPLRSLQRWFNSIKKNAVEEADHVGVVWDFNAAEYDKYVSAQSTVPILSHFIRQEDAYLETLISKETRPLTVLEFGSGTGRTIHHLDSLPTTVGRVERWIGFDVSAAMVKESRRKRKPRHDRREPWMYFFLLDAAHADDNFWGGSFRPSKQLNDKVYLNSHPLDLDAYRQSKRLIMSLLNTTGVLDASTRAAFIKNMFTAALPGDTILISVFDRNAFAACAPPLYHGIRPILGPDAEVTTACFDAEGGNFRVGEYFSHWSDEAEVKALVASAQGRVDEIINISAQSGERMGFICRCSVDEAAVT